MHYAEQADKMQTGIGSAFPRTPTVITVGHQLWTHIVNLYGLIDHVETLE